MIDAYEPPLPNEWVRPIAFIALLVVGAWNVAGWLITDAPLPLRLFLAAFTLTFEVLCFNVSAQKARADERETSDAVRWFWFWALATCCGWSIFSAHNALALFTPDMDNLQRAPAYAVLALAVCIIPLLPWAIERTERAPTKRPSAEVSAAPVSVTAERTGAQSRAPQRSKGAGRPHLREIGKAALAVGAATMGAHAIDLPARVSGDMGDVAWRAQARDLWLGGLHNKAEIARRVGRPRESVRRELLALGA